MGPTGVSQVDKQVAGMRISLRVCKQLAPAAFCHLLSCHLSLALCPEATSTLLQLLKPTDFPPPGKLFVQISLWLVPSCHSGLSTKTTLPTHQTLTALLLPPHAIRYYLVYVPGYIIFVLEGL